MQERDVPGPRGAQVTIEGSTVIVTGASTGIGRAAAVAFRDRGARVVVASRSAERLQPVAEEVGGLAVVCDVGDYDQVQGLVDRAVAWGGKLDIMVNNAGYGAFGLLHEIDPDRVADMFRTNVIGVINGVRAAGEVLVRQGHGGAIVNVSSIVGEFPDPGSGAYAASKAAVDLLEPHGVPRAARPRRPRGQRQAGPDRHALLGDVARRHRPEDGRRPAGEGRQVDLRGVGVRVCHGRIQVSCARGIRDPTSIPAVDER